MLTCHLFHLFAFPDAVYKSNLVDVFFTHLGKEIEAAIYIIVLLHMKGISSALSKYCVGKFEESRGNVNQAVPC